MNNETDGSSSSEFSRRPSLAAGAGQGLRNDVLTASSGQMEKATFTTAASTLQGLAGGVLLPVEASTLSTRPEIQQ